MVHKPRHVTNTLRHSVFQTFGGFTSGIGIHYAPSPLTDPSHQALAPNLIIGQRMLPAVLIRAADARAYNLHDLLPANTLWKMLLFVGDVSREDGRRTVQGLAEAMGGEGGFLRRFGEGRFDIVTICKTKTDAIDYTSIPTLLRPHWSSYVPSPLSPSPLHSHPPSNPAYSQTTSTSPRAKAAPPTRPLGLTPRGA
jgi:hypothetical protein